MSFNSFEIGGEYEIDGYSFTIIKELGEGLTAKVFLAEIDEKENVALKVMHAAAGKEVEKILLQETNNLSKLTSEWEKKYKNIPIPPISPRLKFSNFKEEYPVFIAMELLEGTPLSDVIFVNQNSFEEENIYYVLQIGKILQFLHEDVNVCYPDIKIDNFILCKSVDTQNINEKKSLRVLDWSILGEKNQNGVNRDLFFASLIACKLLTGVMPPYKSGRIEIKLNSIEKFGKLTSDTQQFLKKALHESESMRFQSISEWLKPIEEINGKWEINGHLLNEKSEEKFDKIEEIEKKGDLSFSDNLLIMDLANEIDTFLKIAFTKGEYDKDLWEKLEGKRRRYSFLSRGIVSYKSGRFKEAIDYFENGLKVSLNEKNELIHWIYLAKAAQRIPDAFNNFKNLSIYNEKAINLVIDRDFIAAEKLFSEIESDLKELNIEIPEEFKFLINENKLNSNFAKYITNRNTGKFEDILLILEGAKRYFDLLPEELKTFWVENNIDLEEEILLIEKQIQSLDKFKNAIKDAKEYRKNGNYKKSGELFLNTTLNSPNPELVINVWCKEIEKIILSDNKDKDSDSDNKDKDSDFENNLIKFMKYDSILKINENNAYSMLSSSLGHSIKKIDKLFLIVQDLINLRKLSTNDIKSFVNALEKFQKRYSDTPFVNSKIIYKAISSAIVNFLDNDNENISEYLKLTDILHTYFTQNNLEISIDKETESRKKSMIRELINISSIYLTKSDMNLIEYKNSTISLKIIEALVKSMKDFEKFIINEEEFDELRSLKEDLKKIIESYSNILNNYVNEQKKNINLRKENINDYIKKFDKLKNEYREGNINSIVSLVDILANWKLIDLDEDSEGYNNRFDSIKNELFDRKNQDEILKKVNEHIENGNYQLGSIILQNLKIVLGENLKWSEKFRNLENTIDRIQKFEKITASF